MITIPTDAYVTLQEALQLIPKRKLDAASCPTAEQAEQSCRDIALEINGILRSLGFTTVPFTNSNDIATLKLINKFGAAWMIESQVLIGVQGSSQIAADFKDKYDSMIKKLEDGGYKFESAGAPPASEPESGNSIESGEDRESIFQIEETSRDY